MNDHAVYATEIGLQQNAQKMTGKIVDLNGNPVNVSKDCSVCQFGEVGKIDIFDVQTIIKASGLKSLDEYCSWINDFASCLLLSCVAVVVICCCCCLMLLLLSYVVVVVVAFCCYCRCCLMLLLLSFVIVGIVVVLGY